MELWLFAISVISLFSAITITIDLNESNKRFRGLDEKISKEYQEIKEEIQKLSKKLAK